jgi:cathepsin L
MQSNQRSYHHDEFLYRYRVFKSNLDYVNAWNAAGKSSKLATNKFADLTNEEFRRIYLGVKPKTALNPVFVPSDVTAADVDWRKKGAVTAIKNQGQCGSCWSFSTTGSVEGCHFLVGKQTLTSLSEQNLMDCSTSQGNQGCDGGLMTQAMDYIISNGGIDTESSYPYTAEDGTCSYNAANSGASLSHYTNVVSGNEDDLQKKADQGPVSIAIDASQNSFQLYSSGVYSDPNCSSSQLDHGVLVVGYGTDSGSPYWLVKNSWGTDWGLSGYIEMARNDNNMCGVATMATLPDKCA